MIISQELNGLLFSVKTKVQRAADNATNSQIISRIQSTIRTANGNSPIHGPDTKAERLSRSANMTSSRNDVSGNLDNESRPRDVH